MELFESLLVLMVLAVGLLQISRRFALPYPSLLALAGIGIPLVPFLPALDLEPGLALAVFVTPSLFNAAYNTAPRELKRQWLALTMMAVAAVVVSTVAVAVVGHWWAHLGWAAAVTLGAIVSPPDASAVSAVLNRFSLPRRTLLILEGESLLNDATALLLFGMAEAIAMPGVRSQLGTLGSLVFAIPGGALLGYVLGRLFLRVARWTAGTLSASIAEIAVTFGAWILGERLHVSPILAVVVLAMTVAKSAPRQQPPRDRVHSEALWGSITFILGTIAFLLVGEQVLDIAKSLSDVSLRSAIAFGALVFVTCVVVRIAWVFLYRFSARRVLREMDQTLPSAKMGFLTSWCGIRGMVTIATAAALPPNFPGRGLIVFASFSVVLGTLVVQGFTIGPLIKFLDMKEDDTLKQEMDDIRSYLFRTGLSSLQFRKDAAAVNIRRELTSALKEVGTLDFSQQSSGIDKLRRKVLAEQRKSLITMRDRGDLQEDVFRMLEEELDWAVLASSPAHDLTLEEV